MLFARPPVNLHFGVHADGMKRNDHRVVARGIIFRRQLHEVASARLVGRHVDVHLVEAGDRFVDKFRQRMRRTHMGCQRRDNSRLGCGLRNDIRQNPRSFHFHRLGQIVAHVAVHPPGRQGERQVGRGQIGTQQPTAHGQREQLFGLDSLHIAALQVGGHAGHRFGVQFVFDYAQCRGQLRAVGSLNDKQLELIQFAADRPPLLFQVGVLLLYLADGLQDFARHVFRGKLVEILQHQRVLSVDPPQAQLFEHLLGVHDVQQLLGLKKVLLVLGIGDAFVQQILQQFDRLSVVLALQEEADDLFAVFDILGADLVHEQLFQRVIVNRARGDAHVPLEMQGFDSGVLRRDLRDYLDDLQQAVCGLHWIDSAAMFVEWFQFAGGRTDRLDHQFARADLRSRLFAIEVFGVIRRFVALRGPRPGGGRRT